MRLGLYIPMLDDRPAGVGVYIEEICSRLVRAHRDAVVFTGSPGAKRSWLEGVEVLPLGRRLLPEVPRLEGVRRRARRLRWLASEVAQALPRAGVEVLFSPVQEGPLVGRVPSVVVMHDLTALKFPDAYARATVLQTRWLVPRMLNHAAAVVAVSQSTKRDLVDAFGLAAGKIEVIGEGFDRAVFRPRSEGELAHAKAAHGINGRYLLYAGTFSRHKNLGLVARALHALPGAADVALVLVGRKDAGAFSEFEALVRELGLGERVVTPGYVTREELAALMSGASAFVYPSRYEGFGLAPLEAMACAAPVIASRVASLPEVVGPGGVLVDEPTPAAWARAIAAVLAADRRARAAAATRQAERFDWGHAVGSLSTLLQRVVAGRAS